MNIYENFMVPISLEMSRDNTTIAEVSCLPVADKRKPDHADEEHVEIGNGGYESLNIAEDWDS